METCKILATKSQLESVGIDRNLTGQVAEISGYYPSGYVAVKVDPPEYVIKILGDRAEKEEYDIPEYWLKIN
jgi:hypothetical protein